MEKVLKEVCEVSDTNLDKNPEKTDLYHTIVLQSTFKKRGIEDNLR
jgi:predicted GNAT family acetyltransferase